MQNTLCRLALIAAILAASLLTGCASIVNGTNQAISIETRDKGEMVKGATCKLENGKVVFYVTTPGTVTIHRAYNDLLVKCEKENLAPGMATVKSSVKPMAFGNILFGGAIGAAVDAGSGAAYDYPALIKVAMGETTQIPAALKPGQAAAATAQAQPASLAANEAAASQARPASATSTQIPSEQERRLTSSELSEHFSVARDVIAHVEHHREIQLTTTPDGTARVVVASGANAGQEGYGIFKIYPDEEDSQICLILTTGKYRSIRGCYRLFQAGPNDYVLRAVKDKTVIRYRI